VPITEPGAVTPPADVRVTESARVPSCISLARPKSRILACPDGVMMTFSGLRSRWTTPLSWAAASPRAICVTYSSALRGGTNTLGVLPLPETGVPMIFSRSVSPGTNSITM
jgi:hypothetical protein